MQKINLSRDVLNRVLMNNKIPSNMRCGAYGLCSTYENGTALKFDLSVLENKEKLARDLSCVKSSIYVPQIERLASLQGKVKLSSLPQGVVYCEKVPVAIVTKYFGEHRTLYSIPMELKSNLLSVFHQINDIVDELCQNNIYQLDIREGNFLYSKYNFVAQAIDLDGEFVKTCSDENIKYEEVIYGHLISLFNFLFKEKLEVVGTSKEELSRLSDVIDSCDYKIYGYYGLDAFLKTVVKKKVLDKVK